MNKLKFLIGAWCIALSVGCTSMQSKNTNDNAKEKLNQSQPKLTKPVARKVWVDPEITDGGTVYVEGHWKYLLLKDSQWTK